MVTREELHALVWSEPMTKVAKRYDVSSSYLARVCTALNVPRPPRGYWQQLAVGKAPPKEELPPPLPGDQTTWNEKGGRLPAVAPSRPAREPRTPRPLPRRRKAASETHRLVQSSTSEFRRSRPVDKGGYLKPYKMLLPHVVASDQCIDRALEIASKLYNQLEAAGARVVIAPHGHHLHGVRVDEREVPEKGRQRDVYYRSGLWSPMRPTVAFFEDAAIAIAVVEMSEEVPMRYVDGQYIREAEYQANLRRYLRKYTWSTTQELPSGRVRIVASSAEGVEWSKTWQEKGKSVVHASLPRIAKEIRAAVPQVMALVEKARREAEIRHQQWQAAEDRRKREDDRRRIEQSIEQSREDLGQVIRRWADRTAVERFFEELSQSIDRLPEAERGAMAERLRLAREFLGSVDPLDFFRDWRAPREIYSPSYDKTP